MHRVKAVHCLPQEALFKEYFSEGNEHADAGFLRSRIDAMIKLNDPLAVLAQRLPWDLIEATVAAKVERQNRTGQTLDRAELFGPTAVVVGGAISAAGRPKLPIRLMASLVYLENCFNLSDEDLSAR